MSNTNDSVDDENESDFNYDDIMLDEDHLEELLPSLVSSNDPKDKDILDDLIIKIIERCDSESFRYLLECGYKMQALNDKDKTAIHLARENGFIKRLYPIYSVRQLLDNSIGDVNYVDSDGLSLFHIACEIGCENAVKKFLENKVDVNDPYSAELYDDEEDEIHRSEKGFTSLHFAVKNSQVDIVNLLLKHGANINANDSRFRTPLHIASQVCISSECPTEDIEIMELLLKNKSNVNAKDAFGNTPLLEIFGDFKRIDWVWTDRRDKQMKKLDILLTHGADVTEVNNNGDTVLHLIIKDLKPVRGSACDRSFSGDSHQVELIKKVLALDKADINAKNKEGKSPLDLAISHISSPIVAVLLQHRADSSKIKFSDEKAYFECRPVVPNFDQVLNLTTIIELLTRYGFKATVQVNIAILKFLIHNFNDCDCWNRNLHKINYLRDNVTNLLRYGSAEHIAVVFKKLIARGQRRSYAHYNDVICDIAASYLNSLLYADLFVHRKIQEEINNYILVNDYNMTSYSRWYPQLDVELKLMKSTILNDNLSFYDIMAMHPYKIYGYIKDVNIDWGFVDSKFIFYNSIIKGHMARSIVRNYVENSTFKRLKAVFFHLLSDHLCKEIFKYLCNEDILNMYLALMTVDK